MAQSDLRGQRRPKRPHFHARRPAKNGCDPEDGDSFPSRFPRHTESCIGLFVTTKAN